LLGRVRDWNRTRSGEAADLRWRRGEKGSFPDRPQLDAKAADPRIRLAKTVSVGGGTVLDVLTL